MTHAPERLTHTTAELRIWRDAPQWDGMRTAALGAFKCADTASGGALIREACEKLSTEGFEAVIGPMDGDTWHAYRAVSESDGSRPFLLEPVSGPADFAAFTAAGFAPVSEYVSTRASLDAAIGTEPPVAVAGITITPWDGANAEGLIGDLYAMSLAAFARNRFYKPIDRVAFLSLYRPILPALDPRLILFARDDAGRLAGFLFALPDRLEGTAPKTVILKTYASARRGVGHLLADTLHRQARALGFTDVIHALMHVDNISRERSSLHRARAFRRYALMGRRLGSETLP